MKKIIAIVALALLVALPASAAIDDFVADGNITVTGVTLDSGTTDLLILSGSKAQSWEFSGGAFTVTNPNSSANDSEFRIGSADGSVLSIVAAATGQTTLCANNTYPGTSYVGLRSITGTYTITAYSTACEVTTGNSGSSPGSGGGAPAVIPSPSPNNVVTPAPFEPTPPTTPSASTVLSLDNLSLILSTFNLTRDEAKEKANTTNITKDASEFKLTLTNEQKNALTNFITYGISTDTVKLGAGERRAVLRDYFDTVKRTNVDWQDIERMVNGQKPVNRNLANERLQVAKVLTLFKKIVGHTPNFQNAKEDLAWNTLMYRIRFDRDLTKEAKAITSFKKVIGRQPVSTLDWATVRMIAYSGV